jgi:hypothetical protein
MSVGIIRVGCMIVFIIRVGCMIVFIIPTRLAFVLLSTLLTGVLISP